MKTVQESIDTVYTKYSHAIVNFSTTTKRLSKVKLKQPHIIAFNT